MAAPTPTAPSPDAPAATTAVAAASATAPPAPRAPAGSPLKSRLFLGFWVAVLFSNVGTWIHKVGESWLMTSLTPSPSLVALVAGAAMLPSFLLSIPAGALADVVDRRRLLIATQLWMAGMAILLGTLTLMGVVTPGLLLVFTALLSLGDAINGPAWAAVVPDLVSEEQLASAISLNAVNFNIARALGPAVGGILVAAHGPGTAFLVNAASFGVVVAWLVLWRARPRDGTLPPEQLWTAVRSGLRYVRHEPKLWLLMVRTVAFMWVGSGLWALLPVLAKDVLHLGATGYGTMVGCLGAGAVSGAIVLGRLGTRVHIDRVADGATLLFLAAMVVVGLVPDARVVCALLVVAGAGWLGLLSRLTIAVQMMVPGWVRARALSVHIFAFSGAYALGSAIWGHVADLRGAGEALLWGAGALALSWLATRRISLAAGGRRDLAPSRHRAGPALAHAPNLEEGPVLVTVDIRVDPARAEAFSEAMRELGRVRRRDGAMRWGLWQDLLDPSKFREAYVVESWGQHMRQNERATVADREIEERARAFHLAPEQTTVAHWLSAYGRKYEEAEARTAAGLGVEAGTATPSPEMQGKGATAR